jgi:hypothetical protein
MSMLRNYRASLEQLAATTPKKKAALIRSLLPSTEAALRSGQSMKDVFQTLAEQGLRIEYHVFQVTLWRVRRNKVPTAPGCREKDTRPTEHYCFAESEVFEGYDPLANLRRVEANRPGFHYQPKTLDELVHGNRKSGE